MRQDPPVRRPLVARAAMRTATLPLVVGTLAIGTAVFARMIDARADRESSAYALPPSAIKSMTPPALLPRPQAAAPQAVVLRGEPVMLAATPPALAYTTLAEPRAASGLANASPERDRFGGSALVLDLYPGQSGARQNSAGMAQEQAPAETVAGDPGARPDPTGVAIAAAKAALPQADTGTGNERFAQRVGSKQSDQSQAQQLENLHRLVPQGAIVGAVMETALNSDLPGYARAVVTKDVLSFDGSSVLIPAGSRVIGEYNSGVAQGASRIFIVWGRLIRPDGVSISLGSPAVDELGRGGLGGKVNRHFLQRFGGAILLSVITGGINAAAASVSRGSTVIVSSTNEATSLLTQSLRNTDIPPTIKTKQGALVRIFVARDLDFTGVGPSRP
jgi:type IV secretory pathway VirB10-like protein